MKKFLIILLLISSTLSACGGGFLRSSTPRATEAQYEPYWPTDGWRTSSAEEQGLDADKIEQMLNFIDKQRPNIHSVLIIRNGYIVVEEYYHPYSQDDPHILYSVTKSFMSALIGITIEEGYIEGVDEPVIDFFPDKHIQNLDSLKEDMTLEDLLTMRSGLAWEEGWSAYRGLSSSPDAISYVLDLEMSENPGEVFNYCSGCSHVLSGILQKTTGMNTMEYAQDRLLEPLGISNVSWETDKSGIPIGGWGLYLTPRDMAKFGFLYLKEGVWEDQQIVPEAWVYDSTKAGLDVGPGVDYSYQWWVYPEQDLYAAQGLKGQKIYVIPDLDIVVVFTADMVNTDFEKVLVDYWIIPAVLQ